MTSLSERGRIGNAITTAAAARRRAVFMALISQGLPMKRAAFEVGVADRTARRYRKQGQG